MEDYPGDARQSMMETDEIPFPVPEHVKREVESQSRWKWWAKRWGNGEYTSTGLGWMGFWVELLEHQLAALDESVVGGEVWPYEHKESEIKGMIHGLILMAQEFKDLLGFACSTLPYDPHVRKIVMAAMSEYGIDRFRSERPIPEDCQ